MGLFGSIGGFAGSFFGDDGGAGAANRNAQGRINQAESLFAQTRERRFQLFANAEEVLRDRLESVLGDFTDAESEIRTSGTAAKRGIVRNQERAFGSVNARGAATGRRGDGLDFTQQRAIAADAAAAMGSVDAQIGREISGILQGKASARGALTGDLARFYTGQAESETAFGLSHIDFLNQDANRFLSAVREPSDASGLGAGVGGILDLVLGF